MIDLQGELADTTRSRENRDDLIQEGFPDRVEPAFQDKRILGLL